MKKSTECAQRTYSFEKVNVKRGPQRAEGASLERLLPVGQIHLQRATWGSPKGFSSSNNQLVLGQYLKSNTTDVAPRRGAGVTSAASDLDLSFATPALRVRGHFVTPSDCCCCLFLLFINLFFIVVLVFVCLFVWTFVRCLFGPLFVAYLDLCLFVRLLVCSFKRTN